MVTLLNPTYVISAVPKNSSSVSQVYVDTNTEVFMMYGYLYVYNELTNDLKESILRNFDVYDDLDNVEME